MHLHAALHYAFKRLRHVETKTSQAIKAGVKKAKGHPRRKTTRAAKVRALDSDMNAVRPLARPGTKMLTEKKAA